MARVLLLPGSKWQLILAEKIKHMGHKLYVVSPEESPPCAVIADCFYQSDIFAVDAITDYAKLNGIEAVISDECDIAMPVIAELGDRLGVATLSKEDAALYTDKFLMREFCVKHGLKSPEYKLCRNVEDAVDFLKELGHPIIIKPLDSNASHGVFKTENEADIRSHFDEAMSFSRIQKAVLAERYIVGTEFTVDGIKTPNSHYTLAISEKKHFIHNPSIANELYFTHSNAHFDYEKLKAVNDSFVIGSGLRFGFTHAEYKCEGGEYYLIEIGARGGGNMISSVITQHMSGYDTYQFLVECALGDIKEQDFSIREEYISKAAVLKFFSTPNGGGVVKGFTGIDYLENEPDIKELAINFKVGSIIENCKSDSARIGFYIACSENEMKLHNVINNVEKNFKIVL